jgi:hypothetical protein
MRNLAALFGFSMIAVTLLDAFETILQPRRVTHRFRFARFFYRYTWRIWRTASLVWRNPKHREAMLGAFGPASLLGLFIAWVTALIIGFGLVHWARHTQLVGGHPNPGFFDYLYLSGTTFFTLGYGDVTPTTKFGQILAVVQAGMGFAFLAIIISYLPVLYQAFSLRETTIALLDARAGSPPSASEVLRRAGHARDFATLNTFLAEWETWAAQLLESQLSFPVLAYYRSQHDNQSWLAALATMLDTCALLLVEVDADNAFRAQLTFAVARHAAVDMALILKARPIPPPVDRLASEDHQQLRQALAAAGLKLRDDGGSDVRLREVRAVYEPFLYALAQRFFFELPPIYLKQPSADNWQRSGYMKRTAGIGSLPIVPADQEHF